MIAQKHKDKRKDELKKRPCTDKEKLNKRRVKVLKILGACAKAATTMDCVGDSVLTGIKDPKNPKSTEPYKLDDLLVSARGIIAYNSKVKGIDCRPWEDLHALVVQWRITGKKQKASDRLVKAFVGYGLNQISTTTQLPVTTTEQQKQ